MVKNVVRVVVLFFVFVAGLTAAVQAQDRRAENAPYLKVRGGTGAYRGDLTNGTGTMFEKVGSFGGEIGYQFSSAVGVGVSMVRGVYPKAVPLGSSQQLRYNWQLMFNYLPFPSSLVSPYLSVGGQATTGGPGGLGLGPAAGLGLDLAISSNLSFFIEGQANVVVPDEAVDNQRAPVDFDDALHFAGAGVRFSFNRGATPVEVVSLEGPDTLVVGERGIFNASVNDGAERPITYEWSMGDGTESQGLSASHKYAAPGIYELTFAASNQKNRAEEEWVVEVIAPPEVAAVRMEPSEPVVVGQKVTFSAEVNGSGPFTYNWQLGNGLTAAGSNPTFTYETAGSHTVALEVSNAAGTVQATREVDVVKNKRCGQISELNTVTFGFGEIRLDEKAKGLLNENLETLKQCSTLSIRIDAYTDRAGASTSNKDLSRRRAQVVRDYYINDGVAAERVSTRGLGEASVVCWQEDIELGCRRSRRAESVVVPAAEK